ncbi:MAG TPA: hypothetical protein V6C69_04820 [Trichormus sp.]|jgi:hypothetical protein
MSEDPQAQAAAKPEKSEGAPLDEAQPSPGPQLVADDSKKIMVPSAPEPEAAGQAEAPAPSASTGSGAADSKSSSEPAESAGLVHRRSRWYSSMAALRYVSSLSKDDDVRVRDSDRATAIALLISSILTVLSLVFKPFASHRLALVLACDALVGLMLLFYVANRFGILNTLTPRQALLSWQLMMGAGFIGIFTTINLAVVIALVIAHTAVPLDIH